MPSAYHADLDKNPANYSSLTPVGFLRRSAMIYPQRVAIIDEQSFTYAIFYERVRRMASSLAAQGIGIGSTVAMLCFNSHELLEAHYFVPMLGAVLNALNTRQDAHSLRYILEHCECDMLIYDSHFDALVQVVLQGLPKCPRLVAVEREAGASGLAGTQSYEALIDAGDAVFEWGEPADEWDPISLNYTSGTTGHPKGVVYHHRGAWLAAMSNAMAFEMTRDTVYLWTLPMFHCNGWCYTWAVTAVGGTHVCLRKVDAADIFDKIGRHQVTHMCGAPVVLNMLLHEFDKNGWRLSTPARFALGGAAPSGTVIRKGRELGFEVRHLYGLTESYGPSTVCVWQDEWDELDEEALAAKVARQGVGLFAIDEVAVLDRSTGVSVPADGLTLGELALRGNTLMKGYLKNPQETQRAFADGWLRTGDLAVMHPDRYVEVKDRAKDIIISGGENISSKEIEDVLYRHPDVFEVAVIAIADDKWGEAPCAFITLKDGGGTPSPASFIAYCREHMAGFKVPRKVVLGELPKTATGKIRKNILREQARAMRDESDR